MTITNLVKPVFTAINVITVILLFSGGYSYLIDPKNGWFLAISTLFFPLSVVGAIVLCITGIFMRWKIYRLSALALLICLPGIFKTFAFHFPSVPHPKETGSIRILTWNTGLMNITAPDVTSAKKGNRELFKQIELLQPDVLCLQEFLTSQWPGSEYNYIDSIRNFGYPYMVFSEDQYDVKNFFQRGTILFSKWPIVDSSFVRYPDPFAGSMLRAGIAVNGDTLDVFSTRLQSINFGENEYESLSKAKKISPSAIKGSKTILQKLRRGYYYRSEQISQVKDAISLSKRAHIFTGDMNDVPCSYAYTQVKQNMQDVWLRKGSGIGRTFRKISPTLRIDFIFCDQQFTVSQTKRITTSGSDHNALFTDLFLNKVNDR